LKVDVFNENLMYKWIRLVILKFGILA
jgi:hypothetical protein